VVNPLRNNKYYVIGGRPGSGKRSFADLHFLLGTYMYWKSLPEDARPKFKVFYYNMDKTPEVKLQKLLCTYLWTTYQRLIDVNTINGTSARLFDLDPEAEAYIASSQEFFDDMMEIVEFVHGRTNPTGIYNDVRRYMKTVGSMEVMGYEKKFVLDPENEDQITLVIVDNVLKISGESKQGIFYKDYELHSKFNEQIKETVTDFPISFAIIVPTFEVPGKVTLKQMTPDFREFKYYYTDSDLAIHLFNPGKFEIEEYGGFKPIEWEDDFGVQRLRIMSILRNTEGGDNIQIPFVFVPENGYFYDIPLNEIPAYQSFAKDFRSKYIHQYLNK
jgi:hypothetical protein